MLRMRSILAGAAATAVIGLTSLSAVPAFAHDWDGDGWRRHEWREHREHEWREHEWREHEGWHPAYYHHHYWSGPGYYYGSGGWVYYNEPFAYAPAYAPPPAYAPGANLNVVVPLRIR